MAFSQEPTRAPAAIGAMEITLFTQPSESVEAATFKFEVLDSGGDTIRIIRGNLVPHLTSAQITGLLDFMADLRTQAVNEVIGP